MAEIWVGSSIIESESPRPTSASPLGLPYVHGELVLVVEDDKASRDMIAESLSNQDDGTLTGADGMEAIKLIYARPDDISIVVTDAVMPHLGGAALARARWSLRPGIRFLAMSGSPKSETEGIDAFEIQKSAQVFLTKSFKLEELLGAVPRLLQPAEKPGTAMPAILLGEDDDMFPDTGWHGCGPTAPKAG